MAKFGSLKIGSLALNVNDSESCELKLQKVIKISESYNKEKKILDRKLLVRSIDKREQYLWESDLLRFKYLENTLEEKFRHELMKI